MSLLLVTALAFTPCREVGWCARELKRMEDEARIQQEWRDKAREQRDKFWEDKRKRERMLPDKMEPVT